jgi:hypothetical protein
MNRRVVGALLAASRCCKILGGASAAPTETLFANNINSFVDLQGSGLLFVFDVSGIIKGTKIGVLIYGCDFENALFITEAERLRYVWS